MPPSGFGGEVHLFDPGTDLMASDGTMVKIPLDSDRSPKQNCEIAGSDGYINLYQSCTGRFWFTHPEQDTCLSKQKHGYHHCCIHRCGVGFLLWGILVLRK
jgi:hypothetical protein